MIYTYENILVFWLVILLAQEEREGQKSCWKFEICNPQRGRSLLGGKQDLDLIADSHDLMLTPLKIARPYPGRLWAFSLSMASETERVV